MLNGVLRGGLCRGCGDRNLLEGPVVFILACCLWGGCQDKGPHDLRRNSPRPENGLQVTSASSLPQGHIWLLPSSFVSSHLVDLTPSPSFPFHWSLASPMDSPLKSFLQSQSPGLLTSAFLCILLPDLPETPFLYKNASLARWSSGEKIKLIGALGSCLNPHSLSIYGLVCMPVCFSSHDSSFPNDKLDVVWWWLNWLVLKEDWHFTSLSLCCLDSTGRSFPCLVASHPLILSGLAPLLSFASSQALCFFPTHSPNKHACPFSWSFLACRGPSQLSLCTVYPNMANPWAYF